MVEGRGMKGWGREEGDSEAEAAWAGAVVAVQSLSRDWAGAVVAVQSLSRVRLCNSMGWSTPGFPILHRLPEFAQTHVH